MSNPYKQTVKQKILYHLDGKGWTSKASLESMSREWGVLADNVDRRCRELVNDGEIEREKIGRTVQYRIKPLVTYETIKQVVENEKLFELPIKRFI